MTRADVADRLPDSHPSWALSGSYTGLPAHLIAITIIAIIALIIGWIIRSRSAGRPGRGPACDQQTISTGSAIGAVAHFEPGDRVAASKDIGWPLRRRVKRRTPGVVTGRAPDGRLEVQFRGGRREVVDPANLDPA